MTDDRETFRKESARQAVALGRDRDIFQSSLKLVTDLDRYDYSYLWTWMGVPIIQMPADIIALQEVIWQTKPDLIIETGVARGGSVLFMASILELLGGGTVLGVDIDIRAHNRDTIQKHPMSKRVELIQGGSTDQIVLEKVKEKVSKSKRVMVVLDSDHSYDHVLAECRAYGSFVSTGCYLIVADTLVGHVSEENAPRKRSKLWFKGNDPLTALQKYLEETDQFELDPEINGKLVLASSPGGYLRRI
jgi:cephalosporin hydroxylase